MDVSELLPCPFCGGKADVVSKLRATGVRVCLNDDCTFYNAEVLNTHARKFDAIAAWNRRAPFSADEERAAMLTADAVTHELVQLREEVRRLREGELATLRGLREDGRRTALEEVLSILDRIDCQDEDAAFAGGINECARSVAQNIRRLIDALPIGRVAEPERPEETSSPIGSASI
jgi:cell division protein ZapA (FtsZ GTPase activity inhibitor)